MPAIADLVAGLEHDYDDALATIDQLNAENGALTDALAAANSAKAVLEAKVAELSMRADVMTAMAEKVANSALDMLKAAHLPAGTPAEVIPFAPRPKTLAESGDPSVGLPDVLITEKMVTPKPSHQAVARVAVNVGAVAFSRTGDPATGDFSDAKVIRKFGAVPNDLSVL
jgi:hypothetical protein